MMSSQIIFSSGLFLLFVCLMLLSLLGGYLICRLVFAASTRESLPIGMGLASMLVIVLTNMASHWLNLQWAYILASLFIIVTGGVLFILAPSKREVFENWQQALPPLLVFLLLFVLFLRINQGLAIFDENYNLPIVSLIAAGDVPPHFPFDPSQPLAYHYGLHLLAGVAVRLAGLSPWLAFDAVRAFTHALLLVLAFFWFGRQTGSFWAAVIGAAVVYFGGTTQWLLLFAPQAWIERLNAGVTLTNTALSSGATLSDLLVSNWNIDGLGVVSLPFIFIGSLFKPQNLALTSNGASVALTVMLLLLLAPKQWHPRHFVIISFVLGSIALTAEYLFGLIALGSFFIAVLATRQQKNFLPILRLLAIWVLAWGLALFAGGVISVMFRHLLQGLGGQASLSEQGNLGFQWHWPPSLPTLYFGRLSFFQVDTLLFSLILLAPLLFLIPLPLFQLKNRWKSLCMIQDGLCLGAAVSVLLSLVIGLKGSVGGITRLLDTALLILLILSFPILYHLWQNRSRWMQALITTGLVLLTLGGVVTFSLELLAISRPQHTFYIKSLDARFYSSYWNRLPPQAQIFDPNPGRSIVVFGRSAGAIAAKYGEWLLEWEELSQNPTPEQLIRKGYTHAYLDKRFWNRLAQPAKVAWRAECIKLMETKELDQDFRQLYDLQSCQ